MVKTEVKYEKTFVPTLQLKCYLPLDLDFSRTF